jgi:hypothetical protein
MTGFYLLRGWAELLGRLSLPLPGLQPQARELLAIGIGRMGFTDANPEKWSYLQTSEWAQVTSQGTSMDLFHVSSSWSES